MTGKLPYLRATPRSDCAFSRCCHSGVRAPGRRRGIRSARAAFSRKRAPKSAVSPSSATTRSSTSPGSIIELLGRRRSVRLGEVQRDAVVRPDRLRIDAVRLAQPRRDRHRPRRVHAAAERRQDAHAPVADLVAEPLDDHRPVGRDDAGAAFLLAQEREQVLRGALVEVEVGAKARQRLCVVAANELARRQPRSSVRARTADRRPRLSRTARRRAGRAPARRAHGRG